MPRLGNAKRARRRDEREIVARVERKPVPLERPPESLGPKPDGGKGHILVEQHDIFCAPRQDRVGGELDAGLVVGGIERSEEHTSELQSLMRISYAVFCLTKKKN